MKRITYLLAAGILAILPACSPKKEHKETTLTVKTDTVRVYGEKSVVNFPGKVKAASDINLAFRISGPIAKMYVDAGAYVKKGQVLAEIDSRDYATQLAATEAEYRQVKAEVERIVELYEKQSVAPNDYDKAVYGLKQITAKYEAHQNALADTKLRAPFDGYVQKRWFNPDETVGAGTPVISMISTGMPEVEINIPSSVFVQTDQFDTFSCTVATYPDVTFPLELVGINRKANLNQLYTIRFKVKNTGQAPPSPGMTAMVTIGYKPEASELLQIPLSAMFEKDSQPSVWIYNKENRSVHLRKVQPREIHTDGTVVLSGDISAGDLVVTAGVHSLSEGTEVKLLPAPSSTNVGNVL